MGLQLFAARNVYRLVGGLLALIVAFFLVPFFFGSNLERSLHSDLESLRSGAPANALMIFGKQDLVCFDAHVGGVPQEFLSEARRYANRFSKSLESCGLDGSCCNLDSSAGGIIGLVKGDDIRCVAVYGFGFTPKSGAAFCAPSNRLHVSNSSQQPGRPVTGRPYIATPKSPLYEISERAERQ